MATRSPSVVPGAGADGQPPEVAPAEPRASAARALAHWPLLQTVGFRFVFAYLSLYACPIALIPGLNESYQKLWHAVVPAVGRAVFGVEAAYRQNGSGDTTFHYVQIFCFVSLAAIAAAIWSFLDWRRAAYPTLSRWLRIYVRFYLASVLIMYGSVKVIKSQFPSPSLDRLLQPFGDASPMGLLWTFMGYSESYNVFTGCGEMLAGLLLTTRRTTLLGALLGFAVMGHVAMLNFSYDVPVKQFSLNLLAMSIFLIAPDFTRLARMFVLNRAVEPVLLRPISKRRWLHATAIILRTAAVGYYVSQSLNGAQYSRSQFGDLMTRSPLRGIWEAEEFRVDGSILPPATTEPERWRRVVFDYPRMIVIQLMNDKRQRYGLELNESAGTMEITRREPSMKTTFKYTRPEPGRITMEGSLDGRKILASIRLVEHPDFLLNSRGFHWINEVPFNR